MPDSPSPQEASSFFDNLSKAAGAMQGADKSDDKKKDEKDPMLEYADQLMDMVKNLAGCSDTDMNPMSMLQKGMDFLNSFDSDAKSHNESVNPAKDLANTEDLETVATLAI